MAEKICDNRLRVEASALPALQAGNSGWLKSRALNDCRTSSCNLTAEISYFLGAKRDNRHEMK